MKPKSYGLSLHGYQPLVVDESWLSDEEKRRVVQWHIHRWPAGFKEGWKSYLTTEDLAEMESIANEPPPGESTQWRLDGKDPGVTWAQISRIERACQIAYARVLYNNGKRIAYGDRF
ncbi:hypothetical protein [Adhaeretor mobilis]|uniref:Uncharacterized protein n=1 Tax=Adhaeretor mobilis TaxID=1930276 RepID=A0A517MTG2_9BACT|nr:hypothetical protein [Adhaeretor mobilis]QDS98164.1 hypothetical protein HG15A2_14370 [Adhaeretor mobilis]